MAINGLIAIVKLNESNSNKIQSRFFLAICAVVSRPCAEFIQFGWAGLTLERSIIAFIHVHIMKMNIICISEYYV